MAINSTTFPGRTLFTPEQWKQVTQSPNGRLPDAVWAKLSDPQRAAVREFHRTLRTDGAARAPRAQDQNRLQGGAPGAQFTARTMRIHEIQGLGDKSPVAGQNVETSGIVTQVDDKGFYVQEPNQGIEQGSPAIYVFTGRPPTVKAGDDVEVGGRVEEFTPPRELQDNPDTTTSTTQLRANLEAIRVKSSNNDIPEIVVGRGGIQLSHTESNEATWERLEGARVRLNDAVVTGAPNAIPRFADMGVVTDGGKDAGPRTRAGGIIRDENNSPYVVPMRMPVEGLPAVNIGTEFPKGLVGNVVERHGHHQVTIFNAPGKDNFVASAIQPEVSTLRQKFPDNKDVLFIAQLNGENKDVKVEDINKVKDHNPRNVDDDVGDGKLTRMAEQIVKNLTSPDIVAMQEIQDNDGAEMSDVTDASVTWKAIIDKIVELGGPRYEWVDRPPVNNAEGGEPGGNIRVGFLYNPERVALKSATRLEDPAFAGARVPLVADFEFKHGGVTEDVKLVSAHQTSKRGRTGPEAEAIQLPQAAVLNKWAKENAPKDGFHHIAVFGDRNAYSTEPAIAKETEGGALVELSKQLPKDEQYSTQFGGSSGELDHATAKTSVPVTIDIVHMNSDFDERFRASDHDGTLTAWDFRRDNNGTGNAAT